MILKAPHKKNVWEIYLKKERLKINELSFQLEKFEKDQQSNSKEHRREEMIIKQKLVKL